MKIAGIDYDSNRIDVVTIDLDNAAPAAWFRYSLDLRKTADAFERARLVRDAMPARLTWADYGVVHIAIEQPIGQQKGASPLYRIQGGILACLPVDVPIMELAPYEWRKELGLKGSGARESLKAEGRGFALANGAPAEWSQDPIDAFCIAHACASIYARVEKEAAAAAIKTAA